MKRKLQPHERSLLKALTLALVLFLLPFVYRQPGYADLREMELQILDTSVSHSRHGTDYTFTTASEGLFLVRGKVPSREAFEKELPGKTVTVKYNRGLWLIFSVNYVREMTAEGKAYVTYTDIGSTMAAVCRIGAGVVLIFGLLDYGARSHILKRYRIKYRKWKKEGK